jgi:DNA-binding MarR family transcriptional regulator
MNPHDDRATLQAANVLRRSVLGLTRQLRSIRAEHGVSAAKLGLLARLERAGQPMTASDIAPLQRLQPQSLTRLIADLEARGLIRRKRDEHDRRQFLIEVTPEGHELLARDAHLQCVWLSEAMTRSLTSAERAMLTVAAQLLEVLARAEGEIEIPRSSRVRDMNGM